MQHSFSRTPFRPALERQIGNLSVLTAALLWGTTGTAAHFNQDVSPLATGAFAMGFGGILQAVLSRRILHEELAALLVHKHLVLWAALFIIVYPLAFYSAMEYTGVAMGTVITIATPISLAFASASAMVMTSSALFSADCLEASAAVTSMNKSFSAISLCA